jgi:N-acyl-L-homoserine lactone synthetase
MKWEELRKPDGKETDKFDDERALHMLYLREGTVLGYQRMLPTIGGHLLSEVMPELCEGDRPFGPHIWEWTRYCVARPHRERGRALSPIANALLAGTLPPAVHRLVRDWAARHRAELLDNWERARVRQALQRIPGADVE